MSQLNVFNCGTIVNQESFPASMHREKIIVRSVDYEAPKLFIGSSSGHIVQFSIINNGDAAQAKVSKHVKLKGSKPIDIIVACISASTLLFVSGGKLEFLDLGSFQVKDRTFGALGTNGITCIIKNTNPVTFNPFTTQLIIAYKKKTILIVDLSDDVCQSVDEINIGEVALSISIIKTSLLVLTNNSYFIVNLTTKTKCELFSFQINDLVPKISTNELDEFLIVGPTSDMALFCKTSGIATREPIIHDSGILAVYDEYPFIIFHTRIGIVIKQAVDAKVLQVLQDDSIMHVARYDGFYLLITNTCIKFLFRRPLNDILNDLFKDEQIFSCLELIDIAQSGARMGYTITIDENMRIQEEILFFMINRGVFSDAISYLQNHRIPLNQLFCLLEGSEIESVQSEENTFFSQLKIKLTEDESFKSVFETFLKQLLESCMDYVEYADDKPKIETQLVKLYSCTNDPCLLRLVEKCTDCYFTETVDILKSYSQWHCLATFLMKRQIQDQAFDLWLKLLNGEISDEKFTDGNIVAASLMTIADTNLFWTVQEKLFEHFKDEGINVFIEVTKDIKNGFTFYNGEMSFSVEDVLSFLSTQPDNYSIKYLEHLLFALNQTTRDWFDKLAMYYIRILGFYFDEKREYDDETREKLKRLITETAYYSVYYVYSLIEKMDLYDEKIFLLCRLGKHSEALSLYVNVLDNIEKAEAYCFWATEHSSLQVSKKELIQRLFEVLLNSKMNISDRKRQVISFLERNGDQLSTLSTISALPSDWNIRSLENYLNCSLRLTSDDHTMNTIKLSLLSRAMKQKATDERWSWNKKIIVSENSMCYLCGKRFKQALGTYHSNGVLMHNDCYNKNIFYVG